ERTTADGFVIDAGSDAAALRRYPRLTIVIRIRRLARVGRQQSKLAGKRTPCLRISESDWIGIDCLRSRGCAINPGGAVRRVIERDEQRLEIRLEARHAGFPIVTNRRFARAASHVFNRMDLLACRCGSNWSQNSRRLEILVTNLWTCILRGRWSFRKCLRYGADGSTIRIYRGCSRYVIRNVHGEYTGAPLGDIYERGLVRQTRPLN